MDALKLREHKGGDAFFFRVKWDDGEPAWYKLPEHGANIGRTAIRGIYFEAEEDIRV